EYKKYDHTTQIVSLPGGVKRSGFEINDDNKPIIRNVNQSNSTKLHRDYNSNITCLPGSMINCFNDRPKTTTVRKFQSSDIFNVNQNANPNMGSFRTSNR